MDFSGRFVVMHSGNVGHAQDLASLVPLVVDRAARGDFSPFIAATAGLDEGFSRTMSFGLTFSVLCSEDLPFTSREEIVREAQGTFLWRHTKNLELGRVKPPPCPPVDPATAEDIEQRHLFGQAQRVVKRRQGDPRADAQMLGPTGHVHAHQMHRGAHAITCKVVLG